MRTVNSPRGTRSTVKPERRPTQSAHMSVNTAPCGRSPRPPGFPRPRCRVVFCPRRRGRGGAGGGRGGCPPLSPWPPPAALFAACGRELDGAAASAAGLYRFEVTPQGELAAGVTLPHLMVGTVGGGTGLPAQRACLDLLGLAGPAKAPALAEVCAGLCLVAELAALAGLPAGSRRPQPFTIPKEG